MIWSVLCSVVRIAEWESVLCGVVRIAEWESVLCSVVRIAEWESVLCSVVRIDEWESPCIIIIMSPAKTTILTFEALESSAIRSLIIMFYKIGPKTDPCGQSLVTRLQLRELLNVTWATRSLKKSLKIL